MEAPHTPSSMSRMLESLVAMHFSDSHCHVERATTTHCAVSEEEGKGNGSGLDSDGGEGAEGSAGSGNSDVLQVICATSEADWGLVDEILTLQQSEEEEEARGGGAELGNADTHTNPSPSEGVVGAKRQTKKRKKTIIGGFGIHPWWAQSVSDDTYTRLEALLLKHPRAIVGEIGVDTLKFYPPQQPGAPKCCDCGHAEGALETASTTTPPSPSPTPSLPSKDALLKKQIEVFGRQMCIAGALQRPVSVHVVGGGSYGIMCDWLQKAAENNKSVATHFVEGTAPNTPPSADSEGVGAGPCVVGAGYAGVTPLPPSVIFHGFTGSLDFLKMTMSTFVTSSRVSATIKRANMILADRLVSASVSPSSHLTMGTLSMGAAVNVFPRPEFYVGLGAGTSLKTKSFPTIAGGIMKRGPAQPCEVPHHASLSQKEVNGLKKLPPTAVVLETDCFYAFGGTGVALPLALGITQQERAEVQRQRSASVAEQRQEEGGRPPSPSINISSSNPPLMIGDDVLGGVQRVVAVLVGELEKGPASASLYSSAGEEEAVARHQRAAVRDAYRAALLTSSRNLRHALRAVL